MDKVERFDNGDVNLRPMKDRVIVKRDDAEAQTESGIILHTAYSEKEFTGTVLRVGPDVADVQPGDKILFGKYSGDDIELNKDEQVLIIVEEDILAVIE